jgi:hypothetical protein
MKNEEWGLKNVMNWPGEVIGHENSGFRWENQRMNRGAKKDRPRFTGNLLVQGMGSTKQKCWI